MYILKIKNNKRWIFIHVRTLPCISCNICPTIYVNKYLSLLTYGRAPEKGNNPVVTRNRRIQPQTIKVTLIQPTQVSLPQTIKVTLIQLIQMKLLQTI